MKKNKIRDRCDDKKIKTKNKLVLLVSVIVSINKSFNLAYLSENSCFIWLGKYKNRGIYVLTISTFVKFSYLLSEMLLDYKKGIFLSMILLINM